MSPLSPNQLILLFTLIFALTFADIFRRDFYFGLVYFALFLYVICTAIGYENFPEISLFINAYFGPEILAGFMGFIILSFLGFYAVFRFAQPFLARVRVVVSEGPSRYPSKLLLVLVGLHAAYVASYMIWNWDILSYSMLADDNLTRPLGPPFVVFMICFKLSVAVMLVLYTTLRMRRELRGHLHRPALGLLLALEVGLFVLFVSRTTNRTDPIALMVGLLIFESQFKRLTPRRALGFVAGVLGVLGMLSVLSAARDVSQYQGGVIEGLILKDYFAPAHILLAAMSLDYVDTWEVLKSNACNGLILFNYPYLQATVADLFNPGVSSRSASYAFYIFSEGFLAMGWLGWIYNALVVCGGFFSWRILACSDHRAYRLFVYALLGTQIVNLVRAQSSYFIKTGYMFLLPAFILFFLTTGIRPLRIQIRK